jgi:hypothetical protein
MGEYLLASAKALPKYERPKEEGDAPLGGP